MDAATNAALQIHTSVRAEAQSLFRLLGKDGNTVESLRELIAVPQGVIRNLRQYGESDPAEAYWVTSALRFRRAVGVEFEKLVARETVTPSFFSDGAPVEAPGTHLLAYDSSASNLSMQRQKYGLTVSGSPELGFTP
jgi:hypothetical protein